MCAKFSIDVENRIKYTHSREKMCKRNECMWQSVRDQCEIERDKWMRCVVHHYREIFHFRKAFSCDRKRHTHTHTQNIQRLCMQWLRADGISWENMNRLEFATNLEHQWLFCGAFEQWKKAYDVGRLCLVVMGFKLKIRQCPCVSFVIRRNASHTWDHVFFFLCVFCESLIYSHSSHRLFLNHFETKERLRSNGSCSLYLCVGGS